MPRGRFAAKLTAISIGSNLSCQIPSLPEPALKELLLRCRYLKRPGRTSRIFETEETYRCTRTRSKVPAKKERAMKQPVNTDPRHAPRRAEPARSHPPGPAFASAGLAQLATMMNGSPHVRALAQLKDAVGRTRPMQDLMELAQQCNQAPSAQLRSVPRNHDAGLEHEADLTMTGLVVKQPPVTETPIQRQAGAEDEELVDEAQEEGATEEFQDPHEEAISELLSYATESEVDAMLAGQPKEGTDAGVQDDVTQELASSPAQLVKSKPKHTKNYTSTTTHDGRTYYHKASKRNNRTKKFSGPIVYTQTGRINTPKVRYKRKNDAAGHLIAHSFGGPPTFTGNFVAMNKIVNSAGGDWGKMETYIRKRLKAKNTAAYMSVTPKYADKNSHRPTSIIVTVHFNRAPTKKRWTIATP